MQPAAWRSCCWCWVHGADAEQRPLQRLRLRIARCTGHDVYTTVSWLPHSVWYPGRERWAEKCVFTGRQPSLAPFRRPSRGQPVLAMVVLRLAWFVPSRSSWSCPSDASWTALLSRHGLAQPSLARGGAGSSTPISWGHRRDRRHPPAEGGGRRRLAALRARRARKYSFAFTGVWFWLFGPDAPAATPAAPAMAAVVLVLSIFCFAPFWRDLHGDRADSRLAA